MAPQPDKPHGSPEPWAFAMVAMVAAIASVAYIRYGEWNLFEPRPIGAQVIFSPGIIVGHAAYDLIKRFMSDFNFIVGVSEVVGILAMAVCYGSCAAVLVAITGRTLGKGGTGSTR